MPRQLDTPRPSVRHFVSHSITMTRRRCLCWLVSAAVCCFLACGGVQGVRITKLDVPAVALEGDQVHLRCDYEDEGHSSLYTLKWYKNQQEFFRHQPGLTPSDGDDRCRSHHPYHVDGVSVDCWVSTEGCGPAGRHTSHLGRLPVQVIGEHPTFRKETRKARLTVFSEPLRKPLVAGARASYTTSDTVSLTCTATNTQYLPLLSWRINGDPCAEGVRGQIFRSPRVRSSLRGSTKPFRAGVMTVSCLASFGSRHLQASDVTLANAEYRGTHDFFYNAGAAVGGQEGRLTSTLLAVGAVVVCRRLY